MNGVVGVKEYFGFAPSQFSVNADMLRACMKSPDASLDELLKEIATPYGEKASPFMMQAWEYAARGVEAFPWDVIYLIGHMGIDKGEKVLTLGIRPRFPRNVGDPFLEDEPESKLDDDRRLQSTPLGF